MHLPRHTDPLMGSWSKFAKALPPGGRNSKEEVASPGDIINLKLALPHLQRQEDWAGPSWSSIALEVSSLLLPGVQDPSKSVLLHS
jgi:hypothetical protein